MTEDTQLRQTLQFRFSWGYEWLERQGRNRNVDRQGRTSGTRLVHRVEESRSGKSKSRHGTIDVQGGRYPYFFDALARTRTSSACRPLPALR